MRLTKERVNSAIRRCKDLVDFIAKQETSDRDIDLTVKELLVNALTCERKLVSLRNLLINYEKFDS